MTLEISTNFTSIFRLLLRWMIISLSLLSLVDCATDSNNTEGDNIYVGASPSSVAEVVYQQMGRYVHVSSRAWDQYNQFAEKTCRHSLDAPIAYQHSEYDYWIWESAQFHKDLRTKLLSDVDRTNASSAIKQSLLLSDLNMPAPESYCKPTNNLNKESGGKDPQKKVEEKATFEDALINLHF